MQLNNPEIGDFIDDGIHLYFITGFATPHAYPILVEIDRPDSLKLPVQGTVDHFKGVVTNK